MRIRALILWGMMLGTSPVFAELQVVFEEQTIELSHAKDKKLQVSPARQIVLRIGVDYFYTISDGMVKAYDIPRRKIIYIKNNQKVRELPFYAVIADRLEGFINETQTFQVLSKADVLQDKDRYGIFNIEAKYALQSDIRSAIRPRKLPSGKNKYAYNTGPDMVTVHELSKHTLIRQEPAIFERFLLYECHLHPEVRKDLIIYRRIPKQLIYRYGTGRDRRETSLTMKSVTRINDTVFTKELRRAPRPPISELDRLFVNATANASENAINAEQYEDMFDASMQQSYYLDAMLISVEVYLQTGASTVNAIQRLRPYFDKEPNLGRFIDGLDGSNRKSAAISLKLLEEIDRSNVFRQHIIDLTMANALKSTGKFVAAEKKYLETLRANPYLTGVYVDLGDLYYQMGLMDKAWSTWEMALDLFPQHPMLDAVAERNEFLLSKFPEYF